MISIFIWWCIGYAICLVHAKQNDPYITVFDLFMNCIFAFGGIFLLSLFVLDAKIWNKKVWIRK